MLDLDDLDFTKMADEILSVDDSMRYVVVVADKGKIIYQQKKEGKKPLITDRETEVLSSDLSVMQTMQALYDDSLGRISCMIMVREKLHQLVYYIGSLIFYVTCERDVDSVKVMGIKNRVESIIKKSIQ